MSKDKTAVAHHLLKAQTIHNDIRAQRDLLLKTLEMMAATFRPVSRPVGGERSAIRLAWEDQVNAHEEAMRVVVMVKAKDPDDLPAQSWLRD